MKKHKKPLMIAAAVVAVIVAAGGIYAVNGLRHKQEVFRQLLTETAQDDAYQLFTKSKYVDIPGLSLFNSDDNLRNTDGDYVTHSDLWNPSTELSLYQTKADDMARSIDEYWIDEIASVEKDQSFANMSTADVTLAFKWYDLDIAFDEFNKHVMNQILPYSVVGSETSAAFPVVDRTMLAALEKAEAAGKTREYKAVHKYYLSVAGSDYFTGKDSHWYMKQESRDAVRSMLLEQLDLSTRYADSPTEKELDERKEIIINMQIAIDLYGKERARELLEELGYEGLVAKMIAEDRSRESAGQQIGEAPNGL